MKFVLVACLFLAVLAVTFAASPARPELSAHSIIQNLIGQYEARYHGPSVVHPEEPAHVLDPYNLHI